MAFKIIRNNITKVSADAIVNTANPLPVIGKGTDNAIYQAAGVDSLLAERRKIGSIERGQSAYTPSFNLKKNGIKYIIHTVGTFYKNGQNGESEILRSCYSTSLNLAKDLKCKSVAIPLLATGFYAFPKDLGLQIAIDEISRFLLANEIDVILVLYDKESYLISEKLFDEVQDFLKDNLEDDEDPASIYGGAFYRQAMHDYFESSSTCIGSSVEHIEKLSRAAKSISQTRKTEIKSEKKIEPISIDAFISQSSDKLNFQSTLQELIAQKNLANAEVYKKALIDRKFFSKIISKKNYIPKKNVVMALGLALELPLEDFESFLASAGYAFMPSSKFDLIIKYCVLNKIYNLVEVDIILDSHKEACFATE